MIELEKKTEVLPGDQIQEVAVDGDQLSAIEESEAKSKLDDCLKQLNEIEEDIIRLRRSEYSVKEIVEITGKTRVNVSQISARAKIKLNPGSPRTPSSSESPSLCAKISTVFITIGGAACDDFLVSEKLIAVWSSFAYSSSTYHVIFVDLISVPLKS